MRFHWDTVDCHLTQPFCPSFHPNPCLDDGRFNMRFGVWDGQGLLVRDSEAKLEFRGLGGHDLGGRVVSPRKRTARIAIDRVPLKSLTFSHYVKR